MGIIDLADYEQFDVELAPGDCLVSYTDALIESCDADGKMLREDGLLRIMNLLGDIEPHQLIDTLLKEITERFPENLSADDVTVLMVHANGGSPSYSLREKIGAMARFLKLLVGSLNPRAERAPFPDAKLANLGGAVIPALARRWRAAGSPDKVRAPQS